MKANKVILLNLCNSRRLQNVGCAEHCEERQIDGQIEKGNNCHADNQRECHCLVRVLNVFVAEIQNVPAVVAEQPRKECFDERARLQCCVRKRVLKIFGLSLK